MGNTIKVMGELFKRTQQALIKRKQNIEQGNINSIPSPFHRFRNDFVGLEQGRYDIITSFTKGKILMKSKYFV